MLLHWAGQDGLFFAANWAPGHGSIALLFAYWFGLDGRDVERRATRDRRLNLTAARGVLKGWCKQTPLPWRGITLASLLRQANVASTIRNDIPAQAEIHSRLQIEFDNTWMNSLPCGPHDRVLRRQDDESRLALDPPKSPKCSPQKLPGQRKIRASGGNDRCPPGERDRCRIWSTGTGALLTPSRSANGWP